jgi:hypothetical protein
MLGVIGGRIKIKQAASGTGVMATLSSEPDSAFGTGSAAAKAYFVLANVNVK